MNSSGSLIIFNEETRSYKDLPIKFSEVGTVYRYEQPGEVNGLLRARAITINNVHIYCSEDQIKDELVKLIQFIQKHIRDMVSKRLLLSFQLDQRSQLELMNNGKRQKLV